jgi:hypothetical protein
MKCAQSVRLRVSVTVTSRQPASGSKARNSLATPLRVWTLSYRSTRPGAGGSGSRTSAMSCLNNSFMQTTGRAGSYGRW